MNGRVLIAEDDPTAAAVVEAHLTASGLDVLVATDGFSALALARAEHPDVLLLDIGLPDIDGYAVLAAMRDDADLADIPVVMLTARSHPTDVASGLAAGASDYLRKPVDPAELVARVGSALRTKQLEDQLRSLVRTDPLTGLANRRHLDEHLEVIASAARRHHEPLSVLMVDIDHFKKINDTEGHDAGDAVLREVAARIASALRTEDTAGRWGGEEFLVLAPNTAIDGAVALGDRIRLAVAGRPVAIPSGASVVVTVSVGCAEGRGDDLRDHLRRADTALYAAKARGRNCVVADNGGFWSQ